MGLEMTGFAKANIDTLWIDPVDYGQELYEAVALLEDFGLPTSIFNHQLCTIDHRIWPLAVQAISGWKNEYRPECGGWHGREKCGGFSATARLRHPPPMPPVTAPTQHTPPFP